MVTKAKEPATEIAPPNRLELAVHIGRCAGALLLELLVTATALCGRARAVQMGILLFLHGGACLIAAPSLHRLMPVAQQSARRAGLLFLFSITFFVPLLGLLGMIGGLIAELHDLKHRKPQQLPWLTVVLPDLPPKPPTIASRPEYGGGALSAILRYCKDPDRRLSAVLAARHLRDANDIEVLRLALTDSVDDVRLLAYSILDRREQAFNLRLKSFLNQLQSPAAKSPAQLAKLHKRLAQTHFEMIHLGLCRGEVQRYLLAEARRHIDAALQAAADDCESLFLLGRIALRQDELSTADAALRKAQELGLAKEKALPYLAEVAFRQQRYAQVTGYLRAIDPFYFHTQPLLHSMAAHWLPEEA